MKQNAISEGEFRASEAPIDAPGCETESAAQVERTRDIEFLSLMAHDLRQPLSVVMGMALTLEDQWTALTDDQRRNYVRLMSRSAAWMKTIIDDLLIAGESVGGLAGYSPISFSLKPLVEETIHDLEPRDYERLSLCTSNELPNAYGDPVQQRKVLQNLLGNAVKYSESDTPILVGLTARERMLAVTIADRGRGIPVDEIPTIFEKYSRVTDDDHFTAIEGSGLGLFVCKAIVNAQGGEIDMESNTFGVGSIFTYTLPMATNAAEMVDGS